jgi:hypothetical protein
LEVGACEELPKAVGAGARRKTLDSANLNNRVLKNFATLSNTIPTTTLGEVGVLGMGVID